MEDEPKILIIEDDTAVRLILRELLQMHGYHCKWAEHGVQALELLEAFTPDLILCDINMPLMDGYEFTNKIRTTSSLSHIPIVMLTANVAEEDKINGLTAGALDYIKKPFNHDELILKIGNILALRRSYKANSWQGILANTFQENPNLDEQFVEDLFENIIQNISNSTYSIAQLASDIGISERNLYRRVKENIGSSVGEFIKEVKLQTAHELLTKNKVKTMAEAASKVGYNSAAHFSRQYRQKFNPA